MRKLKISEFQNFIRKLLWEGSSSIEEFLADAKRLASEIQMESNFDSDVINKYLEGAFLEMVILATLLKVNIEELLRNFCDRLLLGNGKVLAE